MYIQSQTVQCGDYTVTQYSDGVSSILLKNAVVITKGNVCSAPKSIGHWCSKEELKDVALMMIQELETQAV